LSSSSGCFSRFAMEHLAAAASRIESDRGDNVVTLETKWPKAISSRPLSVMVGPGGLEPPTKGL
jgi:hypothetical protein